MVYRPLAIEEDGPTFAADASPALDEEEEEEDELASTNIISHHQNKTMMMMSRYDDDDDEHNQQHQCCSPRRRFVWGVLVLMIPIALLFVVSLMNVQTQKQQQHDYHTMPVSLQDDGSSTDGNSSSSSNNSVVHVVSIPHVAYPAGDTFASLHPRHVKVSGLGGWEAKFTVQLETASVDTVNGNHQLHANELYMFKPSHKDVVVPGGWMFRFNKGGFYYQEETTFPTQIINELTAYQVDQLLGLGRVPTVVPYEIGKRHIQIALEEKLAHHKKKKWLRSKMNLQADSWKKWLLRTGEVDTGDADTVAVVGTLQYMLLDVVHPLKPRFKLDERLHSDFYGRELNTRALFDYLIANVDRGNNNFLHDAAVDENHHHAENLPPVLVYIDQNNLSTKVGDIDAMFPFADHDKVTPKLCRFYWEPVDKLRSQPAFSEAVMTQLRAHKLVSSWLKTNVFQETDLDPLQDMDRRRQVALDYIDECINRFGFEHVFAASSQD